MHAAGSAPWLFVARQPGWHITLRCVGALRVEPSTSNAQVFADGALVGHGRDARLKRGVHNALAGWLIGQSFRRSTASTCSAGACTDHGMPTGPIAGFRGGHQLTAGLASS